MATVHQSSQDRVKISTGEYSSLSYELVVSFRNLKCFVFLCQVVFGTTVLLMMYLPVRLIKWLLPSFLPYNVQLSRSVPSKHNYCSFLHAFSLNHDQCQISPHNANSLFRTQVRRIWRDIALMCHQIQNNPGVVEIILSALPEIVHKSQVPSFCPCFVTEQFVSFSPAVTSLCSICSFLCSFTILLAWQC